MHFSTGSRWAFAVYGLLCVAGCGVGKGRTAKRDETAADLAKYGPTSAQKLERLVATMEYAPDASADQRRRLAGELAAQQRSESDPLVRAQIVRTLAACGPDAAPDAVRAAVNDADPAVRIACCQALGEWGGPQNTQVLGELLSSDTDIDVRLAAGRALGETRDPASVPSLAIALEDPDPALQLRAVESLRKVTGRDIGNNVDEWRQFAKNYPANVPPATVAERLRRMF